MRNICFSQFAFPRNSGRERERNRNREFLISERSEDSRGSSLSPPNHVARFGQSIPQAGRPCYTDRVLHRNCLLAWEVASIMYKLRGPDDSSSMCLGYPYIMTFSIPFVVSKVKHLTSSGKFLILIQPKTFQIHSHTFKNFDTFIPWETDRTGIISFLELFTFYDAKCFYYFWLKRRHKYNFPTSMSETHFPSVDIILIFTTILHSLYYSFFYYVTYF